MVTALLMCPSVHPSTHSLIHPFVYSFIRPSVHRPPTDLFSGHQAPVRKEGEVPSFRTLSLSAELTLSQIVPDPG